MSELFAVEHRRPGEETWKLTPAGEPPRWNRVAAEHTAECFRSDGYEARVVAYEVVRRGSTDTKTQLVWLYVKAAIAMCGAHAGAVDVRAELARAEALGLPHLDVCEGDRITDVVRAILRAAEEWSAQLAQPATAGAEDPTATTEKGTDPP